MSTEAIDGIKDKAIAEVIESLIGAFHLTKGHDASIGIMI